MNSKQRIALVAGIGVVALIGGVVAGPRLIISAQTIVNGPKAVVGEADWEFEGITVAEQASHVDLIVRVRVVSSETRVLRRSTPRYADPDGNTVLDYVEVSIPFTDSLMEVLEVYKGSAEDSITVTQTGALAGTVPADVRALTIFGNPIYTVGSEHILFLLESPRRDNSDHPMYVIANPFGRYEIKDGDLITPADVLAGSEAISSSLPATLDELVEQIRQAVEN